VARGGSGGVGVVRRNHGRRNEVRPGVWVRSTITSCVLRTTVQDRPRAQDELITGFDWKNAVNELGEQQQLVAVTHYRISASVQQRAGPERFSSRWACLVVRHDMTWVAGLLIIL